MKKSANNQRQSAAEIRAVAFDGYGTLFNFTEPDFIRAMAEICGQQDIDADAADVWRRFLRASYAFRSEHHHEPLYRRYEDAWAIQFEHVFKRMRVKGDAWPASMHFKSCLAGAVAFDEVYPVIEALRPHYRLALLSNADDDFLKEALQRNGLEFEITITSEQVGAIKPDPEIFHHLARVLEIPPGQVLYAGDNPIPDVLGPSRAGMKSAWINRHGQRKPRKVPQPDIRVRSLAELLPLLLPHD